ncbi:hypothetical protein Ct9H90mP29_10760 [bacterium]|nr:MAG: hypothetical protein Ct9H90mP29_10760 [bacterium]
MEIDDLQAEKELSDVEIDHIKIYLNKNPNLKKQLVSKGKEYFLTIIQPYDNVGLDQLGMILLRLAILYSWIMRSLWRDSICHRFCTTADT